MFLTTVPSINLPLDLSQCWEILTSLSLTLNFCLSLKLLSFPRTAFLSNSPVFLTYIFLFSAILKRSKKLNRLCHTDNQSENFELDLKGIIEKSSSTGEQRKRKVCVIPLVLCVWPQQLTLQCDGSPVQGRGKMFLQDSSSHIWGTMLSHSLF